MYCNTCGAFIEDSNAHFCQSCGAPLDAVQQPENTGYEHNDAYGQNTNNYFQGGNDFQQNNDFQYNGSYGQNSYDVNADNYNAPEAANENAQDESNNRKKTIIVAVSAVVTVALICAAVLASIFITSGKSGKSGNLDELKKGVRAQVVEDVPDSDYIEMRDQPSDKAEMIIKVYEKEYVDILSDYSSENDGYVFAKHLEDGDYKEGWLPAEHLKKVSMSDEYKSLKEGARCRVGSDSEKGDGLSLYKEASLGSDVILDIPEGEHVDVLKDYSEENGEFIYVEYTKDSKEYEGWILGQYAYFVGWAKDFELEEETTEEYTEPENPERPELVTGAVCIIMNNTPYHDGVTMRAQASYNSNKVRVIPEGEYVIVTSTYKNTNNGYVLTSYNDGSKIYRGWISAKFLAYVTDWYGNTDDYLDAVGYVPTTAEPTTTFYEGGAGSDEYKNFKDGDRFNVSYETVGHDGLNLRSGPSSKSTLIKVIEEGIVGEVIKDYSSSDNGYVKVFIAGREGYLIGKYLEYQPLPIVPGDITEPEPEYTEDEENNFSEPEEEPEVEVEIEITETEATTTTAPTTTATTQEPTTEAPTTTAEPEVEVVVGPEGQMEDEIVVDIE